MSKIILVDIDDTLANTRQAMLEFYRQKTNDYSTSIEGARTYWYTDALCPLFSEEEAEAAFSDPKLFSILKPLEGAQEGIQYLQDKGYDVRVCTLHNAEGIALKDKWIDYYFPNLKVRYYSTSVGGNKDVFSAYAIIDDNVKNIDTSPCEKPILLDYFEIQENGNGRCRVTSWNELIERGIL